MSEPLWTPEKTRAAQTTLGVFSGWLASRTGKSFADYEDLHRYSTAAPEDFWSALWDFFSVLGDKGNPPYLADAGKMPGARFFPQAHLNFAENLLRKNGAGPPWCSGARTRSSGACAGTRCTRKLLGPPMPCAKPACARETGWRPSCPTCRRLSSACLPRPRSARCGRPARPTSARKACGQCMAGSGCAHRGIDVIQPE